MSFFKDLFAGVLAVWKGMFFMTYIIIQALAGTLIVLSPFLLIAWCFK